LNTHNSSVFDLKTNQAAKRPDEPLSNTERVISLIDQLTIALDNAIGEIRKINGNTKLLALNARIEAARSGDSGAAFGVVAQEMQALSGQTAVVADSLCNRTHASIAELVETISGSVRGTRLSDLALNCVDLVDRNLYERTCDVRWWATDSAIVDALEVADKAMVDHAIRRMGVILNAYTVYHDLVVCNRDGIVIANGRPDLFNAGGQDVSRSSWFQVAMHSSSGDAYAFEGPIHSPLVNNHSSLVYSCGVRQEGLSSGRVLGVLGVLFKWEAFAHAILQGLPLDQAEQDRTLGLIIDSDGSLVASSKATSSRRSTAKTTALRWLKRLVLKPTRRVGAQYYCKKSSGTALSRPFRHRVSRGDPSRIILKTVGLVGDLC
jgi:hypothetical protein